MIEVFGTVWEFAFKSFQSHVYNIVLILLNEGVFCDQLCETKKAWSDSPPPPHIPKCHQKWVTCGYGFYIIL